MFENWAQPVVSKPWAIVTTVLFAISKATGHRLFSYWKCLAWQKAIGA